MNKDKVFRKIVNPLLLKYMLDPFKYKGSCIAAGIPIKYLKYFNSTLVAQYIINKTLVLTTTNGTKSINIAKDYKVITASFINVDAVSKFLIESNRDILTSPLSA